MTDLPDVLTVPELAERFQYSERTVSRLLDQHSDCCFGKGRPHLFTEATGYL